MQMEEQLGTGWTQLILSWKGDEGGGILSPKTHAFVVGWVGMGARVMFLVFHSRFSYRSGFTAHEFSWTSQHLPLSKYYVAFVCVFQCEAVKCVDPGGVSIWSMFDTIDNVNNNDSCHNSMEKMINIVEGCLLENMMDTAC